MPKLHIGIIREGKIPPDSRVAITPSDCAALIQKYPQLSITVQPSVGRCYSDTEFEALNIPISEDLSHCDVLLGVKEVPIEDLIPNKTYFFFSHTIKKQPYNQGLMQSIIEKRIRLIDYETITDAAGKRLIGFGFYAGIVGAQHALRMYGKRKGLFNLKTAKECKDYEEMIAQYATCILPPMRIVVTGTGKVSKGAIKLLEDAGIQEVTPENFLQASATQQAIFTNLRSENLYVKADGTLDKAEFYAHPERYQNAFTPYTEQTDILINGIFWNENIPRLFELSEVEKDSFNIQSIADVSCDVHGSVPTNIEASTIANPVYGINRSSLSKVAPYQDSSDTIDMMTVDNLPNELPRDASKGFSETIKEMIIPELLSEKSDILDRAEICRGGHLSPNFTYLADYAYQQNKQDNY